MGRFINKKFMYFGQPLTADNMTEYIDHLKKLDVLLRKPENEGKEWGYYFEDHDGGYQEYLLQFTEEGKWRFCYGECNSSVYYDYYSQSYLENLLIQRQNTPRGSRHNIFESEYLEDVFMPFLSPALVGGSKRKIDLYNIS